MKTYLKILQIHSKIKNISYPDNIIKKDIELPKPLWGTSTDKTGNYWTCFFTEEFNGELSHDYNDVHFQIYFFMNSLTHFRDENILKIIPRKHLLINNAINNMFLSNITKQYLKEIFEKTQRTYLIISRFANIVRHKLGKEKINTDLRLEPIDINNKYSICIYHNNAKFFFVYSDLLNIIVTAITNSQDMFPNPLQPKNPYNNLPFTLTHLYNIYFHIKFTYTSIPLWLHLYFLSDFDLHRFTIENEQILREQYIKNYVTSGSDNDLYEEIKCILRKYKRLCRNVKVHKDFPRKDLIEIFRPYIYIYVLSQDGVDGTEKKRLALKILEKKIIEFVNFNPNFGRKNITSSIVSVSISPPEYNHSMYLESVQEPPLFSRQYRNQYITKVSFNEKHPPFTLNNAYSCINKNNLSKLPTIIFYPSVNHTNRSNNNANNSNEFENDTSDDGSDDDDDDDEYDYNHNYNNNNNIEGFAIRSEPSGSENPEENPPEGFIELLSRAHFVNSTMENNNHFMNSTMDNIERLAELLGGANPRSSSSVDIAQQSDLRQGISEGNSRLAPEVPDSSEPITSMEDLGLTFGNMPLRGSENPSEDDIEENDEIPENS
jgi:hypothetical protein